MPNVSVILPVYNVESYLPQCLDSIRAQTLKDIEIIAVDDGSTDDSLGILRKYAQIDSRISVVTRKNGGAGAARNTGIEHATGKYMFFHDPDDFCKPSMLANMAALAEKLDADVVVAGRSVFDNATKTVIKTIHLPAYVMAQKGAFTYREVAARFFESFGYAPWNKLFRRQFILNEKLRYQEIPRNNDMYFVLVSLLAAKRIAALDEAHYCYRTNVKGSLQATSDKTPLSFYDSWRAIKNKLIEYGAYDRVYNSLCLGVVHSSFERLLSLKDEYNFRLVYAKLRKEIFPELFCNKRLTPQNIPNADLFEQYTACMDNENPLLFMMASIRSDKNIIQRLNAAADVAAKLRGQIADLKVQLKTRPLNDRERKLQANVERLHFGVERLKNSFSYRVGLIVTWPLRKLYGGVKCFKENGMKYTVKHFIGKVARKCGSKVKW